MINQFRTPEEAQVFDEYKRLAFYGLFVEIPEKSLEANNAFLVVDAALQRAFNQNDHLDYDYPLRAAEFVRSFYHFSPESKIIALAYISVLKRDEFARPYAQQIKDMLFLSLITGQKPKSPEEFYS